MKLIAPKDLPQEAADNVAMQSPDHLKRWLKATGRLWIALPVDDIVNALPWPDGVAAFIGLIDGFRQHRAARVVEDYTAEGEKYQRLCTDKLELHEWQALVEWAQANLEAEQQRLVEGQIRHRELLAQGHDGEL